MPGMNTGLNIYNRVVAAAFQAALTRQAIIALAIFLLLATFWGASKARRRGAGTSLDRNGLAGRPLGPEPQGRMALRISFGILWVFDSLLQAQSAMAIGLTPQVIEPVATTSPRWVQHVVNWSGTSWSYHPIQAGASAVWIQVRIGIWMLAAPRGLSSRLAALASLGWGLVVWVFGQVLGGIFAGGQSWMFGSPGAVLFYSIAGGLIALPERAWVTARLGPVLLAGLRPLFLRISRLPGL